ncbi:curli production assembly/transport component CsgG [Solimonas aquatica]|uniref:Curli production assembly/transport component CsgG n=1 Tax=Solimonas aquatica TaxID=489703 RepID=A0A1H9DLE5_9GAMM|nr:CsgG/HfaB family protein [Solimonas aquatica]SEQ14305.1 curli production assembly/transport component CsgG [Solimonas aquatica]
MGKAPEGVRSPADLSPATSIGRRLRQLPPPKGPITVAVYGFRDQSGQYKQSPDSSFSTAVTQGGAAYLVRALAESRWFSPVEREGLQDLLTERKIFRSTEQTGGNNATVPQIPNLTPANLLIEGAVVGYDFNVTTGGIGIKYLGISASQQFRKDQVTVNLRAVDTNTGVILHSINVTKTIYSSLISPGVYRFISYKDLFEAEAGYTSSEPVQVAIQEAIETAVVALIVEGINRKSWVLAHAEDVNHPIVRAVSAKLLGTDTENEPGSGLLEALKPKVDPATTLLAAEPETPAGAVSLDKLLATPDRGAARSKPANADEAIQAIAKARAKKPAATGAGDSFVDSGRE